jgi:hypothetical protein
MLEEAMSSTSPLYMQDIALLIINAATGILFFFLGRFTAHKETEERITTFLEKKIGNHPSPGAFKRPTQEDLERRNPHHQAMLKEFERVSGIKRGH